MDLRLASRVSRLASRWRLALAGSVLGVGLVAGMGGPAWAEIVADHQSTDLAAVPSQWIDAAKSGLRVAYGHGPHGSQVISGMNEFVTEYVSDEAMGPDGYLNERGLVVLPDDKLKQMQDAAKDGTKMAAPTS